jgi:hypothetical protein
MARKWVLVGGYWAFQGGLFYACWPMLEKGPDADWRHTLANPDYAWRAIAAILVLTALQAAFVWPVRRPTPAGPQGTPIAASLAIAGLAMACVGFGLVVAIGQLLDLGQVQVSAWAWWPWASVPAAAVTVGLMWLAATPLLMAFCRRGRREGILARAAAAVFTGTIVEVAAIIPLDVMVRRRESCYCWAGTYYALIVCGTVGLFMLGPAVLLPLLARRRKRWYAGWCEVCGYDMRGTMSADRCPECGTGWRPARTASP